jgi:enterochelin esterase-like enzyme
MELQRKTSRIPPQATGRRADATDDLKWRDSSLSARASARRARRNGYRRAIVGAAVAAAVLLAAFVSGAVDGTNTTLVIMGFDPDRAQLITSLLIGAVAAGAAEVTVGRFGQAVLLGFAVAFVLYVGTFTAETQGALAANGINGAFDLGGWLLTLLTLFVIGVASAWAGAALAFTARPFSLEAVAAVKLAANRRRVEPRTLRYTLAMALVLALLLVTVPAFGDLVNYAPDSLMRGGAPQVAAVATDSSAAQSPDASAPAASAAPVDAASATPAPASAGPSPTAKSVRPWLAWLPTGTGHVSSTSMTAPWKGGTVNGVDVTVYTPPGYDPAGSRRYPVLYEAPTGYRLWDGATNVKGALDTLIDSGSMPAMIVAFIDSAGGPFPDTECADSFDHRQWYDTFVGVTMVGWMDAHYKTIAQPAARAVTGMSEGGYCAAILALRHHDVFGTSISFSGYYQAGGSGTNSAAPFGGNKTLMAAYSPTTVAGQLDTAARARLYFVIVVKPDQPEFGPQAAMFEKDLAAYGYRYDAIASTEPHGWPQVRDNFPPALEAWSARMVATGAL